MKEKINQFINYFKTTQSKRPLALVALLIIIAAIPLTVFVSQQQQKIRQQAAEIAPSDNIDAEAQTEPVLQYDQAAEIKQAKRKKDGTKNLAKTDLQVRNSIIEKIKNTTDAGGFVFINDNVAIEYINVEGQNDGFEAQILTTDVNLAKTQAEDWFTQQGISKQGICDLPLSYSLSPDVVDLLSPDTVFDSSPLSCQ